MKIYYAILAFALLLSSVVGAEEPNILILFTDDQRADTIGALGNDLIQTPNLDRLAQSGLSFNRAYMQGSRHAATCIPSRAMLLSGMNLFHSDNQLMRHKTWPESFRDAGYNTFMSGKWHNRAPSLTRIFPNARSVLVGGMTNPLRADLSDVNDGVIQEARRAEEHACTVFTNEVVEFIQNYKDSDPPFFAFVPYDGPHDPHIVPEDYPVYYNPDDIPLSPSYLPQHPWDHGSMTVRDEWLLPWPRTPEEIQKINAEYWRYISFLDQEIGRVLDALEASPAAKNTIIVFASDSGVARGSHGLIGKQNVYEYDSVRVPLIISGPGIPQDQQTEAMCYLFDLLPTLGNICGIDAPNRSDGIDFSATLKDPDAPARDQMVFAYKDEQLGYTDGPWKLIRYPKVDRTQLFDLQTDPHEANNLAQNPEHADRVLQMMQDLQSELQSQGSKASLVVENPESGIWTAPEGKRPRPNSTE